VNSKKQSYLSITGMQNSFGDLLSPSILHFPYSEKIAESKLKISRVHVKNSVLFFWLRKIKAKPNGDFWIEPERSRSMNSQDIEWDCLGGLF
jgi:hypothetical protein